MISRLRTTIPGLLLLMGTTSAVLFSCKGNIACQNPPQTLRFGLRTADGRDVISAGNAQQVSVQYYRNGQRLTENDIRVIPPSVESLSVLQTARQTNDTTRFYVSVANQLQGVIQLKTYVDNSPCDGWTHISELRFNGRVVPYDNLKPGYTLTLP